MVSVEVACVAAETGAVADATEAGCVMVVVVAPSEPQPTARARLEAPIASAVRRSAECRVRRGIVVYSLVHPALGRARASSCRHRLANHRSSTSGRYEAQQQAASSWLALAYGPLLARGLFDQGQPGVDPYAGVALAGHAPVVRLKSHRMSVFSIKGEK